MPIPLTQKELDDLTDDELDARWFAVNQGGTDKSYAGQIIAEIKRRERIDREFAKRLKIAELQERTTGSAARATRGAAWAAGIAAAITVVLAIAGIAGLLLAR